MKFQTYSGRTLYSTKTPRFDFLDDELAAKPAHELLDEIALPREWQPILAEHCRERGVEFMSSPFDRQAVDELDALDVGAFKIASFELVDLPFIRYAAGAPAAAHPLDGDGEPRARSKRPSSPPATPAATRSRCCSARRCIPRPRT